MLRTLPRFTAHPAFPAESISFAPRCRRSSPCRVAKTPHVAISRARVAKGIEGQSLPIVCSLPLPFALHRPHARPTPHCAPPPGDGPRRMPRAAPCRRSIPRDSTSSRARPPRSPCLPPPTSSLAPRFQTPPWRRSVPSGAPPPCGAGPGAILPAAQLRDQSYVVVMPGRVVAPVGSEVIVVSGICGEGGHYVMRQPLEWMMSPDCVGHVMEVSNDKWCFLTDWMRAERRQEARSRLGQEPHARASANREPRHRAALNDDVVLGKGQSWVSVMSPTEGASYVTVMAPKEENWDQPPPNRHDLLGRCPVDPAAAADRPRRSPRAGDCSPPRLCGRKGSGPIEGWLIRYEVIDGPLALFENDQRSDRSAHRHQRPGERAV